MHPIRKRGSITIFFLMIVLIIFGSISYSMYMGRLVETKIKVEAVADESAFAMAVHGAQGLNMISANNLSVGASIHIASSFNVIARYISIVQVIATSWKDIKPVLVDLTISPDETKFAKGFNILAPVSGHYMKTAAGLTSLNRALAKYWLYAALPRGIEHFRRNLPGSIGLPMRTLHPAGTTDPVTMLSWKYEFLKVTSPVDTLCHSIKASEALGGARNLAVAWLRGPIESITGDSSLLSALEAGEELARGVGDAINTLTAPVRLFAEAAKVALAAACDPLPGFLKPGFCGAINDILDIISSISEVPIPKYENCGLNHHGDFGVQLGNFIDKVEPGDEYDFGFIYIDLASLDQERDFDKSLEFAVLVGQPEMLSDELTNLPGKSCPDEWVTEFDGMKFCSVMTGGMNMGFQKSSQSTVAREVTAGGVNRSFQSGLANPWKRTAWSLGQARVRFTPSTSDPVVADTRYLAKDDPARPGRKKMQTFWPAWSADKTQPTVINEVLGFLRN